MLARYNADGSLDASFGTGGWVTTDFGLIDIAESLTMQADGKVLVAGYSVQAVGFDADFAIARYNPDGSLDPTFGTGGRATTDFGSVEDYATGIGVRADGTVVVAGYSYQAGTGYDFAVARYNPDGTLDASFDIDGRVTTDFGSADDYGYAVAVQPDGKVVVPGQRFQAGTGSDLALARYNADGSLDSEFGTGGRVLVDLESPDEWAGGAAVQPDGNIVVAGMSYRFSTGQDFVVARLLGGATEVTTPAAVTGQLDQLVETATLSGQPAAVTFQAETQQAAETVVAAVNGLAPPAQPLEVVVDLGGGDFAGVTASPPPNVTLTFVNGTFNGASPALTVASGVVVVRDSVLTNATDAPTIVVTGGTLILRGSLIEESTGYAQTAISVTGGTVDLGTAADPGGNTVNVNGPGAFVSNITATPVTADGTVFTVDDAPLLPGSLSGIVWEDFNADGDVNFGERGIGGTSIRLTGADDLGNPIDLSQPTDADGAYLFLNLRPGTYQITETQPAGYLQGINAVGTAGGTVAAADQFLIPLGPNADGLNYNFGERPTATGPVEAGQAAGIGFWNNKHGQALIRGFNGGTGTQLADWLAATLPNTFGVNAGANNLTGKGNGVVADLFQQSFLAKGVKLDAQVLATALSVYATHALLDPTHLAAQYGFAVGGTGLGTAAVNVGDHGAAFGVANDTTLTVMDLLLAADAQAVGGVLYGGNAAKRKAANDLFSLVNQAGGI
jgi:uncharacterized delta-60 repeat protein